MLEFDPYDYSYPNGWMDESFDAFRRKHPETNHAFFVRLYNPSKDR